MISDAVSSGLAGIGVATRRIEASAHNVANLNTQDFRPLEVRQAVDAAGHPQATTARPDEPRDVDLAREIAGQVQARTSFQASLRTIETGLEMRGQLLDLLA